MRVVFVSEVPTSYRAPLFQRLRDVMDLHVLYCAASDPWRGSVRSQFGPHEVILDGVSLGGKRGGIHWKLNPSVWRRLSSLRPDVVVISGYAHPTMQIAMLWCRTKRVPYVLHSESNDLTPRPLWRRVLKAPIVKWAIRGSDSFLPVSKSAAEYLVRRGGDPARMFVLPNAPDVEQIARETHSIVRDATHFPTFLFVGRLVPAKDPRTLLNAFSLVRDEVTGARLSIIGEGPLRPALEAQCARQSIGGVAFLGFIDQSELPSRYADSDCFILPSTYEPYGVVVLEAMAAGLPVILSDRVGSAQDLVRPGENGFIFRSGDREDLAGCMRAVASGGKGNMGACAREMALLHTYDKAVETVMEAARCAVS